MSRHHTGLCARKTRELN